MDISLAQISVNGLSDADQYGNLQSINLLLVDMYVLCKLYGSDKLSLQDIVYNAPETIASRYDLKITRSIVRMEDKGYIKQFKAWAKVYGYGLTLEGRLLVDRYNKWLQKKYQLNRAGIVKQ